MRIHVYFIAIFAVYCAPSFADPESYPPRTQPYMGAGTTVLGDNHTIGMAGAGTAVPDSISATEGNPAGLAMALVSLSAQLNSNSISDTHIQPSSDPIESHQWGFSVNPPPYGFGLSYFVPEQESATLLSPVTGALVPAEVEVSEWRATFARMFFNDQLSLGVSLIMGRADELADAATYSKYAFGYQLGALYRLPAHFIVGLSYRPAMHYAGDDGSDPSPSLPGFFQGVESPSRLNFSSGWLPNRYFMVGWELDAFGATPGAALLRDQTIGVGDGTVFQPRVGLSYIVGQWHNFKIETAAGSYYEVSRIDGYSNRLHATASIDVQPWFVNVGFGIDEASSYSNVMFSVGFDLVRSVRAFGLIPPDPVPPYNGWAPPALEVSADGLAGGVVSGEKQSVATPSVEEVKKIIQDIPKRIKEKLGGSSAPADLPAVKTAEPAP